MDDCSEDGEKKKHGKISVASLPWMATERKRRLQAMRRIVLQRDDSIGGKDTPLQATS